MKTNPFPSVTARAARPMASGRVAVRAPAEAPSAGEPRRAARRRMAATRRYWGASVVFSPKGACSASAAAQCSTPSISPAESAWFTWARPTGMRKKSAQSTGWMASICGMRAGKSSTVCRHTVVLTWSGRPMARARSRIRSVWRWEPRTPRNASWASAVAPSRLTASRPRPASRSARSFSSVTSAVPLGVSETVTPRRRAWPTSSTMSGRRRGSPPVSTRIGGGAPNAATRSMSRQPSSVVSSAGSRRGIASARQWTHASAHARVVSQMTMKGARSNAVIAARPKAAPGRDGGPGRAAGGGGSAPARPRRPRPRRRRRRRPP